MSDLGEEGWGRRVPVRGVLSTPSVLHPSDTSRRERKPSGGPHGRIWRNGMIEIRQATTKAENDSIRTLVRLKDRSR